MILELWSFSTKSTVWAGNFCHRIFVHKRSLNQIAANLILKEFVGASHSCPHIAPMIARIFGEGRMVPMTLGGLTQGMRALGI